MPEYITLDISITNIAAFCFRAQNFWLIGIAVFHFFQTRLTTIGEYLNLLACALYKNRIRSMFRIFVLYFENIACGDSPSLSSKMKTKLLFFISLACTILFRNLRKACLFSD